MRKIILGALILTFLFTIGCDTHGWNEGRFGGTWTGTWSEGYRADSAELQNSDMSIIIEFREGNPGGFAYETHDVYIVEIYLDGDRYLWESIDLTIDKTMDSSTLEIMSPLGATGNIWLIWEGIFDGDSVHGTWVEAEISGGGFYGLAIDDPIASGAFAAHR